MKNKQSWYYQFHQYEGIFSLVHLSVAYVWHSATLCHHWPERNIYAEHKYNIECNNYIETLGLSPWFAQIQETETRLWHAMTCPWLRAHLHHSWEKIGLRTSVAISMTCLPRVTNIFFVSYHLLSWSTTYSDIQWRQSASESLSLTHKHIAERGNCFTKVQYWHCVSIGHLGAHVISTNSRNVQNSLEKQLGAN